VISIRLAFSATLVPSATNIRLTFPLAGALTTIKFLGVSLLSTRQATEANAAAKMTANRRKTKRVRLSDMKRISPEIRYPVSRRRIPAARRREIMEPSAASDEKQPELSRWDAADLLISSSFLITFFV